VDRRIARSRTPDGGIPWDPPCTVSDTFQPEADGSVSTPSAQRELSSTPRELNRVTPPAVHQACRSVLPLFALCRRIHGFHIPLSTCCPNNLSRLAPETTHNFSIGTHFPIVLPHRALPPQARASFVAHLLTRTYMDRTYVIGLPERARTCLSRKKQLMVASRSSMTGVLDGREKVEPLTAAHPPGRTSPRHTKALLLY